jgi:hypothetical protein
MDEVDVTEDERSQIYWKNAMRIFQLDTI